MTDLTDTEREQIATILERRANEIAAFNDDLRRTKDIASVEFGLSLEVKRLRRLAARVNPPKPDEHDE